MWKASPPTFNLTNAVHLLSDIWTGYKIPAWEILMIPPSTWGTSTLEL